jgi:high-affinity iron transporter
MVGAVGSVLSYVFYWLAVIVALVTLKYKEGRTKFFGFESTAGRTRRIKRESDTAPRASVSGEEK